MQKYFQGSSVGGIPSIDLFTLPSYLTILNDNQYHPSSEVLVYYVYSSKGSEKVNSNKD